MMTADRFNLILDKYRDVVGTDSARARKIIMKLNYRNNFYLLHCIAQTYLDESRFEDGNDKMRRQVDQRKWRMAEKYIIKSMKRDDDNAETLYTMGQIRKLGHQDHLAVYCFKRIIKLGVGRISSQQYSRGRDFARMLINDARFELYRIYFYSDRDKSANYLSTYKEYLKRGVYTIYYPLKRFLL